MKLHPYILDWGTSIPLASNCFLHKYSPWPLLSHNCICTSSSLQQLLLKVLLLQQGGECHNSATVATMGWPGRKTSPSVRPKIQKWVSPTAVSVRWWRWLQSMYPSSTYRSLCCPDPSVSLSDGRGLCRWHRGKGLFRKHVLITEMIFKLRWNGQSQQSALVRPVHETCRRCPLHQYWARRQAAILKPQYHSDGQDLRRY